ncbi:helix-turn-helix domain-containing protein [Mycobacteroides abscessus]|uniref:helix-turn-helix domain-containing protein n=2 Tax=Mycobacteroides abscessus TaxID=36809 RepID=UPI0009415B1F|nr:helix-turn-helix domain-containing protein [Mycobacteroides abscessus subsp. abscessus]MBN7568113.1 helix-turn-helix domain-containing protein [Mycobacteroides abscessus subsp. abscessus]
MNAFGWARLYFRNEDRELRETKATMAALYSYCDFDTLVCWPSQRTLASVTGLDVRTVRRHISKNIAKGWLSVVEPGVSKTQPNRYQLRTPTPSVELEPRTLVSSVEPELRTPTPSVELEPRTLVSSVEPELRTPLTATEDMGDRQLRSPVSSITNQRTNQGTTHREGTEGADALSPSDLSSAPFGGSESSHRMDDDPWGIRPTSDATNQPPTEDMGALSTEGMDDPWGTLPDRVVEPEPASVAEPVRPKPVPKPDCCANAPFCPHSEDPFAPCNQ